MFDLNECEHINAEAIGEERISKETEISGVRLILLLSLGLSSLAVTLWLFSH